MGTVASNCPHACSGARVIDHDPVGCLFGWPRASLRQWLAGLGSFALLLAALYFLFSAVGL